MKKTLIFALVVLAGFLLTVQSHAQTTLADWTFETTFASLSGTGTSISGIVADAGLEANNATLAVSSGVHASASSVFSSPAGNGSTHSFSSNNWNLNDYWQFQVSTAGYDTITVAWDQTGSSTGPRNYSLSYSTDGTNFTPALSYSLPSPAISWTGTAAVTGSTSFTYDFSGVTDLDDTSAVYFRLSDESATSGGAINGGNVGTAGTDRVDNFVVSGMAVPEPSTIAVVAFGGSMLLVWRRRRSSRLPSINPLNRTVSNKSRT